MHRFIPRGFALALIAALAVAALVVPAALALTVTGSLTNDDPTQTGRLLRDGVSSSCATPKANPGLIGGGGAHHYDAYTFFNSSDSTQCVTVVTTTSCADTNFVFVAAYSSFVPANPSTNWLADPGLSPFPSETFSVNISAHTSFDVVVSEVTPGAGCSSYTLDVTGTGIISGDAAAIADLQDTVAGMGLDKGLTTALNSKLQEALDALEADNTAGACDSMKAFLNQVAAQQEKKKLTEAQAQQLTAAANEIRTLLDC